MAIHADDLEVLEVALDWLQHGHQVALTTVVRTWGSSPRPPGSLMAMNDQGRLVGSVSGGCVEATLVARYCDQELSGPQPTLVDFGVDRQQAARMGLPCGGRLELLVEHLSAVEPLQRLVQNLHEGRLITRRVTLPDGQVSLQQEHQPAEFRFTQSEVLKTFGPAWQILIIGDGQLARYLAGMALQLDYRVAICDPRDLFTDPQPLDDVSYSRDMPDDAVRGLSHPTRTAIVTVAHDPRQDDLALCAALESQVFYIGALGSQRSAQARRQRLLMMDYTASQIDRIHGPAGLPIGSKRPAEIALSIMAEITSVRNNMGEA